MAKNSMQEGKERYQKAKLLIAKFCDEQRYLVKECTIALVAECLLLVLFLKPPLIEEVGAVLTLVHLSIQIQFYRVDRIGLS